MEAVILGVLIVCSSLLTAGSVPHSYCVKPDSSVGSVDQCKTLQEYTSNGSEYFTNNTSFLFLPGIHALSSISLHNVSNMVFKADMEPGGGTVTIHCNNSDSGGLIFKNACNVTIANLSFLSCGQPLPKAVQRQGETSQTALAFFEVTNLLLESVSVSHSKGYGVLAICIYGNFAVNKSNFIGNKGNAIIEYSNCSSQTSRSDVEILSSTFKDGSSFDRSSGLLLKILQGSVNVTIKNTTMENNKNNITAELGGNMLIRASNNVGPLSSNITISNCTFANGTAYFGAGVTVIIYSNHRKNSMMVNLLLNDSVIANNTCVVGCGLYYIFKLGVHKSKLVKSSLMVQRCLFNGNMATISNSDRNYVQANGVAVELIAKYADNAFVNKINEYHYKINFEDCIISNNSLIPADKSATKLVPIGVALKSVNIDFTVKNCNISDNNSTGIALINSKVRVFSSIVLKNNTGINGGGMFLCESSYLILTKNSSLLFSHNKALWVGGGIFIENRCSHTPPLCFYQFVYEKQWNCTNISQGIRFKMVNNTAGWAGDHIYGGDLDSCRLLNCNSRKVFKNLTNNEIVPYGLSAISSQPTQPCFCSEEKVDCTQHTKNLPNKYYPGETIHFNVATVGQFSGIVPGTVMFFVVNSSSHKKEVNTTSKQCTPLSIKLETMATKTTTVLIYLNTTLKDIDNLTPLSISKPLRISIPLNDCPAGFTQRHGNCMCEEQLEINNCNISNKTITRTPPAWIGFNHNLTNRLIYHAICPYDYCRNEAINIKSDNSGFDQDSQCAPNRTGFLCSKCKESTTLSLGSSNCIKCDTKLALPLTIIGLALAGITLVLLLIIFNITYTDGMFSGLMFYANAINMNKSTFLPQHQVNIFLRVVVNWMSLDYGIESCFYYGMDQYAGAWSNFLFAIYLFILVLVIVFLCKASERIAKVLGGNVVKVLATLLILTYTKLMKSIVEVLSSTVIKFTSGNETIKKVVWAPDPDIAFFAGKHIPLALLALLFGLLILTYTLVLLFVQPLQRYSHLCCFRWVAQLKPFIDAYTAPHIIKDNCRYWEGLLLLCRLMLVVICAVSINDETKTIMTALICILIITIAWCAGGIYKKTHLKILNSSFIFNLTVTSLALSNACKKSHQPIIYTSCSTAILTLCGVLACHVFWQGKKWFISCKRWKYKELDNSLHF